jgi:hypothetical protein
VQARRSTLPAAGVLLALLAGCSSLVTPVAAPPSAEPALVRVTVAPPDPDRPVYIEGALRYIRITGGATTIEKQLEPDSPMQVRLPGGDYRITSWARVCGGNCGNLGGPTDRCSASFSAAVGRPVDAQIDAPVGQECTIAISS